MCVDVWGSKGRDGTQMQKAPCDIGILKRISRYCEHSNLDPIDYIMYSQKAPQTSRANVYIQVNRLCRSAGIDKVKINLMQTTDEYERDDLQEIKEELEKLITSLKNRMEQFNKMVA